MRRGHASITVRYVRTTQWPSTPWKRANQANERKGSLLGTFLKYVKRVAPEAAEPRVFAIVGTWVPVSSIALSSDDLPARVRLYYHELQRLADGYERAVMDFFKPGTLLNSQPGGRFGPQELERSVALGFVRCRTSLVRQIRESGATESQGMRNGMKQLFDAWFEYAHGKIWDLQHPAPSAAYIQSTHSQAAPQLINGTSVAVICAEDPPQQTLKDGAPFFSGKRNTSDFVTSTLSHIGELEGGSGEDTGPQNVKALQSVIGFNQLYQLPKLAIKHKEKSRVSTGCSTCVHGTPSQ